MKILIVGSKGFIGSNLFNHLHSTFDAAVWGCDIASVNYESNYFQIDPFNSDYSSIFKQSEFDYCINCSGASSVPDSFKFPLKDFELNVLNVIKIADAIRHYNSKCKLINLSSAAVYGSPNYLPVTELSDKIPISPYGVHKLISEQVCSEYFNFYGTRTCSIRIFSAYGPGLHKQLFWDVYQKTLDSNNKIELLGQGEETRDYLFINDLLNLITIIINKSPFESEVYNAASGIETTIKDAVKLFVKLLGWKGEVVYTGHYRKGDPQKWVSDISKIKKIGFSPEFSLHDGLSAYVKWLKESK